MKAQREIEEEEIEENRRRRIEKKEKQKKADKTPFDPGEFIEWMINKGKAHINNEYLKNILNFKSLVLCIKFCTEQMIKKKIVN